jgi:hypothetical protein
MTEHITPTRKDGLDARPEPLEPGKELAQRSDQGEANRSHTASGNVAALDAPDWLCLAATPTLAIIGLLMGVLDGRPTDICSAAQGASPLSGMVPMYLLMSAFHSAPWLKLFSRRQGSGNRTHNRAGLETACSGK